MASHDQPSNAGLKRAVTWTRFLIYIPVVALFIGAAALIVLGGYETAVAVFRAFFDGTVSEKETLVDFITLADIFLLATVLYIIALGLYQLFIDDTIPLPDWLVVHDLDDLKEKLASVVIVVLAVFFLGTVVKSPAPLTVLWQGLGIGAMILALSVFLLAFKSIGHKQADGDGPRAMIHAMEEEIAREESEIAKIEAAADGGS
jgi:uncharacterized membrane protein YqhA